MTTFRSNEEAFQATRDLVAALDAAGHARAAAELNDGFGCLNGLTDGWAMFLESIERVRKTEAKSFDAEHRKTLDAIRGAARSAMRRR